MSQLDDFSAPDVELLDAAHCLQRARERYGFLITDDDLAAMRQQIIEGRAIFISAKPGRKKLKMWMVWWPSARRIVPIYFRNGSIKTILPQRSVEKIVMELTAPYKQSVGDIQ
ncbi:hypothetical protein M2360_000892 [Rhizobium sp. SG_E_25_P2]|uniref:hypothetical protein n=1 Tax=Rhizobium sp. SG_E_25_P2 TaxID=2879942 RepID=UPI0024752ECA|nr:hypothetical protein [Rhizobium sp. SG_E_25_P2]MDH6265502.1 hypothetical protein [Rhizobium sp. SG_E_25_P2]